MGVERDTQRHKMTHRDTEREMHEPAKLVSPHTHTHTHTHTHKKTPTHKHKHTPAPLAREIRATAERR